ncbi:heavy metal-binding domain-containing protein [Hymenobacter humi]|uniref:Heavy metal-binding domain-containing protein n=1 Tax=Hymenobacter humi TaxID=1411620 RepID=A0ABW2UF50_9BACT
MLLVALSSAACQKTKPANQGAVGEKVYYTCSMHPQIHEDAPGTCPICGMNLIAVKTVPVVKSLPPAPPYTPARCTHRYINPNRASAPYAAWTW